MPIIAHFRNIFSNTPNTFSPTWQISVLNYGAKASEPLCGHHELLKWPSIGLDEILIFFTSLNGAKEKAWICWLSSGKLSCKSFQEFYAPFLLKSFLEHVPVFHICSFFLHPILVPRFPVYHFRQSGFCFSLGGAPSFALSTWSFE